MKDSVNPVNVKKLVVSAAALDSPDLEAWEVGPEELVARRAVLEGAADRVGRKRP